MFTSLILTFSFLVGIGKRLRSDASYRALAILTLIVLLIGTLYTWLVGKWPFVESMLYAVTTMSMNTPYGGPLASQPGPEMVYFHMFYSFLSVGVFIVFTLETSKTMAATYSDVMKKLEERKAKKSA